MILLEPSWLLLLALLPALFFWPRSGARRLDRALLLRSLTLTLLILALAHPVRLIEDTRTTRVLIVDDSASLADEARPALEATASALAKRQAQAGPFERFETTGSALGAALTRAAAAIPVGRPGAITLLTDSAATDDSWRDAARELAARGIPVHAVAAGEARDPRLTNLAPVPTGSGRPRVGAPLTLAFELLDAPARFDVQLRSDGAELARQSFEVPAASRAVFHGRLEFEPRASQVGFAQLTLSLASGGLGPTNRTANDRYTATIPIEPPLRVAYLGERMAGGRAELARLLGPGLELEPLAPADLEGPAGSEQLGSYAALVLDDIPAASLGERAAATIAAAVRGGLGLFATGGTGAFGPGGWHDTAIEPLLPVELVQKEEKRDPSTTLVVIIDTSGSMGGNRVQLAKEVARLAIRRLLPHDKVGIVEFYGAKHWAAPIQPASNAIELERALNRLSAGGGTVILPAIEEAFYGLKNVHTRYKHVLILTDGGVETGAFEPLLRAMAEDGVNTSTVLIGSDAHSEFLVTLANWGKGRFYSVPNRFNLPEILLKQPTTAKLPAWRPGPHALVAHGGPHWWGPFEQDAPLPELDGYIETRLKPGAASLLETAAEGHPVLATWSLGLGRVTAFTSEPAGEGTTRLGPAEFFGPLFARVLERTARSEDLLELRSVRHGALVQVSVEGNPARPLETGLTLATSSGAAVSFTASAPGRATAQLIDTTDGAAPLELEFAERRGKRLVAAAPARRAELAVPAAWHLDLALLATATGGSLTTLADLSDPATLAAFDAPGAGGSGAQRESALWPLLLFAAILSYLLEILLRRLDRRPSPSQP